MTDTAPEPNPDVAPPTASRDRLFTPPFQPQVLNFHLIVHVDPDSMWAEIHGMPGLFATGARPTELGAALGEAVELYLAESVATAHPEVVEPPTEEQL